MTVGIPLPAEVKFFDQGLLPLAVGTGNWQFLQKEALGSIPCNATTTGRIGRQIKLVGIVYRISVVTFNSSIPTPNGAASPFTIDFICDKQCNGAYPTIAVTATSGTSNAIYSGELQADLPNVRGQDRFTFLRRVQVLNPLSAQHNIVGSIACNHLITYDTDSTTAPAIPVSDLATKNIVVTYSSLGPTNSVTGNVRYYYVDA